jgi:hypothetical protein
MYELYAAIITGFPLFRGFTLDGARMLLASGEVKEYSSGEVLLKEGDSPTFVLLVLAGKMQVFVEVRSWVNWPCYAALRDRLRCARARNRRPCNGAPRLFAAFSCAMSSCRSGYSANRSALSSKKSGR